MTFKDLLTSWTDAIYQSTNQNEWVYRLGIDRYYCVYFGLIKVSIKDYDTIIIEEIHKSRNARCGFWQEYIDVFLPAQNMYYDNQLWKKSMIDFMKGFEYYERSYWNARRRYLINLRYPRQWWNPARSRFREKHLILV